MTDIAEPEFVHLRVRSALSLLQSTIGVDALVDWAVRHESPAIAVTDDNTMFGALELSEKLARAGVQPLAGLGLSLKGSEPGSVALIAGDAEGYANLLDLSSQCFIEQEPGERPAVAVDTLLSRAAGLICLTGGESGRAAALVRAGNAQAAIAHLHLLAEAFGDRLYVELQRHGEAPPAWEAPLVDAAYACDLPLVATHDARFVRPEDHGSHKVLMCIANGVAEDDDSAPDIARSQYLRAPGEMARMFADLPESLASTVEIARRCAFRPETRPPALPGYPGAESGESELLAERARAGLRSRLAHGPLHADPDAYRQRLEYELGVVSGMGFAGYFLIVADFVGWALEKGIPVGPGRGSGAGSLVAYALRITDLDPLRFGLLFERFLNPERVSMPDFDIDFCQERRGEVIEYVQGKFGGERVAHIITFGTLQARAVLRDVGRVMQMPFGKVDRLAKMVPFNPANPPSLDEALKAGTGLAEARDEDPEVARLISVALDLEGLHRNASTHAAGIVVADRPIRRLAPLCRDPKSGTFVTQFSMKWAEAAGLVKFDFLGLKTLSALAGARQLALGSGEDWDSGYYSLEDRAVFDLLSSGAGMGVFQMESAGMRDTLRKVRPDRIEDLIALISLYRPGPMKNIDRFVSCKRGETRPDYLHPDLKPVLEETYGVIVYQEQVMQIARILANYSLAEADLLRRAMGKKLPEEMAAQKTRFMSGAAERGVGRSRAETIFELVAEFAGYGFNKSHAAAYAVISYRTAWLKAYFPAAFMAASMSLDRHNTDRLAALFRETRRMGIAVLPPDVTRSGADFTLEDGAVRYALAAIKGIGHASMDKLVRERARNPFTSLVDLAERVDSGAVGRRGFELLASVGALDALEPNRALIHAAADRLGALSVSAGEARRNGQSALFGDAEPAAGFAWPEVADWDEDEKRLRERDGIGFYLSGHPLEAHFERLSREIVAAADAEAPGGEETFSMIGLIGGLKRRRSRQGREFGLLMMSDPSGPFELLVPPEQLSKGADLFSAGTRLRCRVRRRKRFDGTGLVLEKAVPLSGVASAPPSAAETVPMRLALRLDAGVPLQSVVSVLRGGDRNGGGCLVHLTLGLGEGLDVTMELGRFRLGPRDIALLEQTEAIVTGRVD